MKTILEDNELDNNILGQQIMSMAESVLTDREMDILVSYNLSSSTYREIGKDHNLSASRIQQILENVYRKITKKLVYEEIIFKHDAKGKYVGFTKTLKNRLFDSDYHNTLKYKKFEWSERLYER
jgi:DNA-binding CsgD family transcriptional regulator